MKTQIIEIAFYVIVGILSVGILGFLAQTFFVCTPLVLETGDTSLFLDITLLGDPKTWLYGLVILILVTAVYFTMHRFTFKSTKRYMKGSRKDVVESALENSHFMADKERDKTFRRKEFTKLGEEKKDGVPVYAVYNPKKKELELNLANPVHGIIIGSTGSGKTTLFINPMIQILGQTAAHSSMIVSDPKGELFQMHSGTLAARGYKSMVLDLRDPYSSFRWNPLGAIYDRYQDYVQTGYEIYLHDDELENYPDLTLEDPKESFEEGAEWYEYEGKAYADGKALLEVIKIEKQKIYDECYEDLNDLISCICPVESKDDPVWEKGAKSIVMAVALGMLEDSENPKLEMTKEKFNFYNLNKAISNSENGYENLKKFFEGRSRLSKAYGLSRQTMSAAEDTLNSYMSIALDKLSMFNDEGLCALTSATDIDPAMIANEAVALFMKIPDEKDTRYPLAALFITSIYKALIKVASSREDLSLPRNVYFVLDEFGNLPKIDKFDKMITVGRSRKIWFEMVVQSFAQLENIYGKTVGEIIKSNCGLKMFIGSNDIETCDEFSKLCGNMTVSTSSVSTSTSTVKTGELNVSSQLQQRPLIYPSELQRLNHGNDIGNAIIVTFGNNPLRTKFTPSYRCPLYKFSQISLTDVRAHAFFGDEVYYDLEERNYRIQEEAEAETENENGSSAEAAGQESDEGNAFEDEDFDERNAFEDEDPGERDAFGDEDSDERGAFGDEDLEERDPSEEDYEDEDRGFAEDEEYSLQQGKQE